VARPSRLRIVGETVAIWIALALTLAAMGWVALSVHVEPLAVVERCLEIDGQAYCYDGAGELRPRR
jgi:hypothetical protein